MSQLFTLQITPEQAQDDAFLQHLVAEKFGPKSHYVWRKRSLDARKRTLKINATLEVFSGNEAVPELPKWTPLNVSGKPEIAIIGSGPAGLFAAMMAISLGLKPVIFERGKDVRARRRDLAALNKLEIVNPESNYCFGEGGAGTYSDGKLYTRSKKRGDVLTVLQWLVQFGAPADILVEAHPHIGTNKLPVLITNIREAIMAAGGAFLFEHKLTDIFVENNQLRGIEINNTTKYNFNHLVLATGHSARDIFELLYRKKIEILAKPFALGVRVEHTQKFIDQRQYHGQESNDLLPPASYQLVTQVDGHGVYSFCMCPGGIIAPCATAPGEVVTNGWSPSKRNNIYANSGIVVGVAPTDLPNYAAENPFVCLDFQRQVEQDCHIAAGGLQKVPAQRLKDFVENKLSKDFPRSSYLPGITSVNLNQVLPQFIAKKLVQAFKDFDKKMPGFITNDAVVHAPESRTSSPVQIPRDAQTLQHTQVAGLYPCGEGAGYAGGIVSAAVDGINVMQKIADSIKA